MNKKIAVIDLGTNTFNLLIAEFFPNNTHQIIYTTQVPSKIGEKSINDNTIIPSAFERGIQCLRDMKELIEERGADKIHAFGTSALRGAANGKEFVEVAKKETGIQISIIDGDQEAELIYNGVQLAYPLEQDLKLIMDIGGGSNEFIIANKEKIFWRKSFNLGMARILYKFNPSNPMKKEEAEAIDHYLDSEMQPLWQALRNFPTSDLIGCAGAFSSIYEMICAKNSITPNERSTFENIEIAEFENIHNTLLPSTFEERMEMPGLSFMRTDMIVIGTILVQLVLTKAKIKKLYLSKYALKEGVLNRIAHNKL